MAIREAKTFCRVCVSSCGAIVEVDGERVVRVRGDRDHPLTGGYTCSKGRALPESHHGPNRLLAPQLRREGVLRRADWDEALDDITTRLSKIMDESGPQSIGVFVGSGGFADGLAYWVGRRIPRALGTPQVYSDLTIDAIPKLVVSELMAGIPFAVTLPDYERCRLVLYVATNPLVSHGHTTMFANPTKRLRDMMARGEVWVIDPRRTETAAKATRHLATRPGSDYAVLAYLVRELLRDGADRDYLARHAQDVDRLAAAVEPFDAQAAAKLSGLSTEDLAALLEAIRRAGRLTVETGTGLSMARSGGVVQWLSMALMAVTGSLDREGGAWFNPGFHTQMDRRNIAPAPPEGVRRPGPKSRPDLPSLLGEYPSVALADEIEAGHLRVLINLSANLVTCMPDTDRTLKALGKLDVLATIDVEANATTAVSTHVFPAKDQLERADIPLGLDMTFPEIATTYAPPVVTPLGEARSFWWTLAQIGKRLGCNFVPGLDPDTATDDDVMALITARSRRDLSILKESGYVVADRQSIGWLLKRVDAIGGWRLAPDALVDQLARLDVPDEPLIMISRRRHHHMNSRVWDSRDPPGILLSAEDAKKAGLETGSRAVVRSAHGELEGIVQVDDTLMPGVMNVPHGFAGVNVNKLTSTGDADPLSGMALMSGLPVSVHPV